MSLKPFTRNFEDNSTEAGFEFTFYCDLCQDGYKTRFIESNTYKKGGLLRGLGQAFSIGSSLFGSSVGYQLQRGADVLSERFTGMSPEWHKEHEEAFELAQNEARGHFQRCPNCKKYVCESDWNETEGLCVDCSPRESVKVAAAKADKMVKDIEKKADETTIFTGEVGRRQTICPSCQKPANEGKFCNNCGAPLSLTKCPKCGAELQAGSRFCGGCGTKL